MSGWTILGLWLWQAVTLFTPLSLYGIWPDMILFLATIIWTFYCAQLWSLRKDISNLLAFGVSIGATCGLFVSFVLTLLLYADLVGTKAVPKKDELQGFWLVNQYFTAVGVPGCGMGTLTTAKACVFFPFVEYRTDLDPCTLEDWGCFIEKGTWEGCY